MRRAGGLDRLGDSLKLSLVVLLLAPPAVAQSPEEFFETRVRPVLAEHCYSCHGRLVRGELRMDSRESLLEGGVSGPAIVPGDPDASLLIRSVRHEIEGREMGSSSGSPWAPRGRSRWRKPEAGRCLRWPTRG